MPKTYPPIYIDPSQDKPRYNPAPNAEKLVYDALRQLNGVYYVFHSYGWQGIYNNRYKNGVQNFDSITTYKLLVNKFTKHLGCTYE